MMSFYYFLILIDTFLLLFDTFLLLFWYFLIFFATFCNLLIRHGHCTEDLLNTGSGVPHFRTLTTQPPPPLAQTARKMFSCLGSIQFSSRASSKSFEVAWVEASDQEAVTWSWIGCALAGDVSYLSFFEFFKELITYFSSFSSSFMVQKLLLNESDLFMLYIFAFFLFLLIKTLNYEALSSSHLLYYLIVLKSLQRHHILGLIIHTRCKIYPEAYFVMNHCRVHFIITLMEKSWLVFLYNYSRFHLRGSAFSLQVSVIADVPFRVCKAGIQPSSW